MHHIAIIGSGHYGEFIQSVLKDFPVPVSVIDGHQATEAGFLEAQPATHVIIATPNFTHVPLVKRALEAGKHVLCEKPLALHPADVTELYALAKRKKVSLSVGFVLQNHIFYQTIRQAQAVYGPIKSIRVMNIATEGLLKPDWYWDKSLSGGWFLIAEIHWYHLFAWLTSAKRLSVAEASEEQRDGRTFVTHSRSTTDLNQELSVTHRLDATYDMAWTKVEIEFEHEKMMIDDWVPKSLDVLKMPPKFELPDDYPIQGKKIFDSQERNQNYAALIRFNIQKLLADKSSPYRPVYLAHAAAEQAQKLSDIKSK